MEINRPEILAEVTKAFLRYEKALGSNDVATIDTLFWDSPRALRYGPNGTLVGHAAISAFRHARDIPGIRRTLRDTHITTFGRDFAVANTESDRPDGSRGRQSQTWVRMAEGWRIVAAHVSDEPRSAPGAAREPR